MSDYDIKFRERKKVIVIKQILRKWPEHVNGFPAMKIVDQEGKKHFISCLDAMCLVSEWDKIEVGSKIEITLRESVAAVQIIFQKPFFRRIKEERTPQAPYYRWTCKACGETRIVSYEEWEEALIIGKRIKFNHKTVSPSCGSLSLEIIDHHGKDKTEDFRKIVGIKPAV